MSLAYEEVHFESGQKSRLLFLYSFINLLYIGNQCLLVTCLLSSEAPKSFFFVVKCFRCIDLHNACVEGMYRDRQTYNGIKYPIFDGREKSPTRHPTHLALLLQTWNRLC